MRGMKWQLLPALVVTSVVACSSDLPPSTGSTKSAIGGVDEGFADFGYSDIYRYYGGPAAVGQEVTLQRQQDQRLTEKR